MRRDQGWMHGEIAEKQSLSISVWFGTLLRVDAGLGADALHKHLDCTGSQAASAIKQKIRLAALDAPMANNGSQIFPPCRTRTRQGGHPAVHRTPQATA